MTTVLGTERMEALGPWRVDDNQSLLEFLRDKVGWIAQSLIDEGVMLVEHPGGVWPIPGRIEYPADGAFALVKGDTVAQKLRQPAALAKTLQQQANDKARDLMFSPGLTDFEIKMADFLLAANPQLQKIDADDFTTFLTKLKQFNDQPIGTIHIVAHGWVLDQIYVKQRPQRPGKLYDDIISYEGLEDAVADRSLAVDPSLFQPPRPIDPDTKKRIPGTVRIWACRAGLHRVFLEKLREALGGAIGTVSAPLHLQGAGKLGSGGRIEFLRQEFRVSSRCPLDRASLIKQFQAGNLPYDAPGPTRFADGQPVPAAAWDRWLPKAIHANETMFAPTQKIHVRAAEPGGHPRTTLDVLYSCYPSPAHLLNWNMERVKPRGEGDALAKLPDFVAMIGETDEWGEQDPHPYRWNDKHPLPMSVRGGYKNFAELVDGFKWKVTKVSDFTYSFEGTRWVYSILVPITDGDDLVCNGISAGRPPEMLRQFRDDDPRFYTVVGSR